MNDSTSTAPATPAPTQVMTVAMPLIGMTEALSALGASLQLRRGEVEVTPEMAACLDGVLGAIGVRDAVDALDDQQAEGLLGIVHGLIAQAADFVVRPDRTSWDHTDPSVLVSQGNSSVMCAMALRRHVVPGIGGDLGERLDAPGASFLDIGSGVAALSIAMCRIWPSLRVVGVDPWDPAIELARESVAEAGLEDRIELRRAVAEALEDADDFDLAWIPTFFIPRDALQSVVERTHAALRPGGWVTLGVYARPGDPFRDALADLRTVRQGGTLASLDDLTAMLERAGFADVGVHYDAEWGLPVVFVAGRREA